METKNTKASPKINSKLKSIRINSENQRKAERILLAANKKKGGRRIKINELLNLVLDLVSDEHIKKLQEQSLSNEDRKEILRQRWAEFHGPISKEEFTGIMMTKKFFEFLAEHPQTVNAA